MAWKVDDLEVAVSMLDPALPVDAQVAALNAQTVTLTTQPFPWSQARQIAFNFGVWANIVVRARGTPTIPPATVEDGCIITAITAISYQVGDIIDPSVNWAGFEASMSALVAIGDITSECYDAILALANPVVPVWNPPVEASDVLSCISARQNGT